jgi:hypothetical protein
MNNKLTEILEANNNERQKLLEKVNHLSQNQLDFRPAEDEWSVGEILSHLNILEGRVSFVLGKKAGEAKTEGHGPDLTDGSVLDCLDRYRIHDTSVKVKAPEPVTPKYGIDKQTLLDSLTQSRAMLAKSIETMAEIDPTKVSFPHPLFGDWNLYQWALAVGKHEERHGFQIDRIKGTPGFPVSSSATVA